MRLISVDEYNQKTMQLAKPIFDKQKRVLLAAGRTIHPVYLEKLIKMDIRYLFVEDAVSFGITLEEMVDVPTWIDAIGIVQGAFEAAVQNGELSVRELQKLITRLVEEVGRRKVLVLIPSNSLAEELRFYAHAVNVTLLALQLAKKMNISQMQLKELALGALIHDIGKLLTEEEDQHTRVGFDFVKKTREISLLSAHVCFQHHEQVDGKGKPRGLNGEQIHLFAQIAAICNIYENAISKEGYPPHEALEYTMTKSGSMLSADIVKQFINQVPTYIPGTKVMINNGRTAIVTKIVSNMHRPFIRYLDSGEEISLAEHHTLLIKKVIEKEEVLSEEA